MVERSAAQSAVLTHDPCPSAQFTILNKYIIVSPVRFDPSGGLVAGAWTQPVDEKGCGAAHLLNVLVLVKSDRSVASGALLPGTTHADPILQHDSMMGVYQATALAGRAAGESKDCKTVVVANTDFIAYETGVLPGAKGPPWLEKWTVITCTKQMIVPMRFIPDATGTSFSAGPSTAVKVTPLGGGH